MSTIDLLHIKILLVLKIKAKVPQLLNLQLYKSNVLWFFLAELTQNKKNTEK